MNPTIHRIAADLVLRERVSLHRQQQRRLLIKWWRPYKLRHQLRRQWKGFRRWFR